MWQGALASLIYFICRMLTRAAAVRHVVGHVCLALFLLCQAATLSYALGYSDTVTALLSNQMDSAERPLTKSGSSMIRPLPTSPLTEWTIVIEPFLPWVATGWLAGLATQVAWMFLLMTMLRRELKRSLEVTGPLRSRLLQIAGRIRGTGAVRFVESQVISVPATVGWLRPVVLMPTGWALKMPPRQVEASILHELAHIARRDYMTSLLRSFLRAAYFFHLPLRWMIHSLNSDAEQAADDLAASALGDYHAYGNALLELEIRRSPFRLLLGADGGSLKQRLRHLLEARRGSTPNVGRLTGTLGAGAIAVMLLGYNVAGAAEARAEVRWQETHTLTTAVLDVLGKDQPNPRAEALIASVRGLMPVPHETLLALRAELQHGFSSTKLLEELSPVPATLKLSQTALPTFGTQEDRRRLVQAMMDLADSSSGIERRDAARAALILCSLDLIDRNGTAAERMILDPKLRAMLALPLADSRRLENAVAVYNYRVGFVMKLADRDVKGETLTSEAMRDVERTLPHLPGIRRLIARDPREHPHFDPLIAQPENPED